MRAIARYLMIATFAIIVSACAQSRQSTTVNPTAYKEAEALVAVFPIDQIVQEPLSKEKAKLLADFRRAFPGKDDAARVYIDETVAAVMKQIMPEMLAIIQDEFARNFTVAELKVMTQLLGTKSGREAMVAVVSKSSMSKEAAAVVAEVDRSVDPKHFSAFTKALNARKAEVEILSSRYAENYVSQNKARLYELGLYR
jgi:hypothetical protein